MPDAALWDTLSRHSTGDDAVRTMDDALHFACPQCGQPVPAEPGATLLQCPACGDQFFVRPIASDEPDEPGGREPREPEEPEAPDVVPGQREEELNALRIRQVSALRRATYRSRSYAILGAVVGVVAIGQLFWLIVQDVRAEGWVRRDAVFVAAIVLAVAGSVICLRRAAALQREIRQTLVTEPTVAPDFSSLSDGSQHARNLEDMTREEDH